VNGLNSFNEITVGCVTEFLSLYAKLKPKYISTVLCVLRNYFDFLKHMKFIKTDLAASLPPVRILIDTIDGATLNFLMKVYEILCTVLLYGY
jgi:hypothetical protein